MRTRSSAKEVVRHRRSGGWLIGVRVETRNGASWLSMYPATEHSPALVRLCSAAKLRVAPGVKKLDRRCHHM